MVATNSRGPLFALLGAIAVLLAVRLLRPVTALAVAGLVTMGALAASLAGITPTSALEDASRSDSPIAALVLRGQDIHEFSTLTGRTELWALVGRLALARPIAGYGYQGSRELLLDRLPWAGHAHNGFLQTLLDLGVVGAVLLWVPFLLSLFARPPSRVPGAQLERWASASVFAALTYTVINSLTDVGFAGAPGYEILLFLCSVVISERLASLARLARLARLAPPARADAPAAAPSGRRAVGSFAAGLEW
jgi:O-antigen ligase